MNVFNAHWTVCVKTGKMVKLRSLSCFSCVWLFVTLWTVTHQAPLSVEFFRQEYWSGLPCPSSGGLADPGTEPGLLHCRRIPYCLSHRGSRSQSTGACTWEERWRRQQEGHRGQQRNLKGWQINLLSWLWWFFHGCVHVRANQITYLNMCSLLYANYTLIKLVKPVFKKL